MTRRGALSAPLLGASARTTERSERPKGRSSRQLASSALALGLLLGCGERAIDVELVLGDGVEEGLVYEVAVLDACPEDLLAAERSPKVGPLFVREGAPLAPSWELDDGDAIFAIGRDATCRIRAAGCGRAADAEVALEVVDAELRCEVDEVCSASRCVAIPTPGERIDVSELASVCGFAPGEWRFGPAERVLGMSVVGVEERLPTAAYSARRGLERFVVRGAPGAGTELLRSVGSSAPREMGGSVSGGREGRAVAFGAGEHLLVARLDESWIVGEGPRTEDGENVESYSSRDYGPEPDPWRRDPFVTTDGLRLWLSEGDASRELATYTRDVIGDGWRRSLVSLEALRSGADETAPSVSRDGRLLVFGSDRSGTDEIYVSFLGGGEAFTAAFALDLPGAEVGERLRDPFLFDAPESGACALYFVAYRDDDRGDVLRHPIVER